MAETQKGVPGQSTMHKTLIMLYAVMSAVSHVQVSQGSPACVIQSSVQEPSEISWW